MIKKESINQLIINPVMITETKTNNLSDKINQTTIVLKLIPNMIDKVKITKEIIHQTSRITTKMTVLLQLMMIHLQDMQKPHFIMVEIQWLINPPNHQLISQVTLNISNRIIKIKFKITNLKELLLRNLTNQ